MKAQRLEDRVCLVTGAASGIGLACAQRFIAEGARVVGFDLQDNADWEALEAPAGKQFHALDVRDFGAQQEAVAAVLKEFKRIDVLVTAAGVGGGGAVHELAEEEWDRVLDINLKGTYLGCKAVLPTMLEQRSGSIITLASVEGLEGTEGGSCYNASKGGVILLTRNMAIDYARRGIRVNAICPGFIDTPLLRGVFEHEFMQESKERIIEHHKMGRFGKAEEIAGAVFFLASDDASFVTGQALPVDGGFTAGHSSGVLKLMGLED